jgi:hypothetical protein
MKVIDFPIYLWTFIINNKKTNLKLAYDLTLHHLLNFSVDD